MNGRVFAVSRSSPVVSWEAQPLYPDMPAAAAISPTQHDPYSRCWHNQVDAAAAAGTSFPYFGPLYNNSLPPTAYRLQPGCMPNLPNLGQFWPPTPPPDGCGRYDGSNLYFAPPVLRHADSISSNIRSPYQGLGHYSHLVDTPKDSNQQIFKQETSASPNVSTPNISMCSSSASKSESLKPCCAVDSKLKSPSSFAYSLPKQDLLTVSSSGHESYLCVPDIRTSSNLHPSAEKSCFAPSYSQLNPYHSSSQDKSQNNSSPLKNVYFSHYESENVNSVHKNFESDRKLQNGSKPQPQGNYRGQTLKRFDHHGVQDFPKGATSCVTPKHEDGVIVIKEHFKHKSHPYKVKAEKNSHSDCKYQNPGIPISPIIQGPERSDMFGMPTSAPKMEHADKYFIPSCSSAAVATSYVTSSSFLRSKDVSQTGYQGSVYPSSCSLGKPWQFNDMQVTGGFFKSPEALKPPPQISPHFSPLHKGQIFVAQTAPQDIEILKESGTLQSFSEPAATPVKSSRSSEMDDEVMIIGEQKKHSSPSKYGSRHSEKRNLHYPPVFDAESLTVKTEMKKEKSLEERNSTSRKDENFSVLPPLSKECASVKPRVLSPLPPKIDSNPPNETPKLTAEIKPIQRDTFSIMEEASSLKESKSDLVVEELVTLSLETSPNVALLEKPSDSTELKIIDCCDKEQPNDKCDSINSQEGLYNVNHGLNLLLNTLEKLEENKACVLPNPSSPKGKSDSSCQEFLKVRGLDLLSAIAGERLVSEFDGVQMESEDSCAVKSNYPDIKDVKSSDDETIKQFSENSTNSMKSSVFEMHDRLVELQKKYKQKQKELSRLKPKKRLANTYLKGHKRISLADSELSSTSNTSSLCTNENLNSSSISSDQEVQVLEYESKNFNSKAEEEPSLKKTTKCLPGRKKSSNLQLEDKRITRHSAVNLKTEIKCADLDEQSNTLKRTSKSRTSKLKQLTGVSQNDVSDNESQITSLDKESHTLASLPESRKVKKVKKAYALRHSAQNSNHKVDSSSEDLVLNFKVISSKRKCDNPKKYVPSKQTKLSETIVAKHLRSRILFDTSGSMSDDDNAKDGVPEDLYDALMKCHLDEESRSGCKNRMNTEQVTSKESPLGLPAPSMMKQEHLMERQRLLALEDNLFYAGFIKEYQMSNRYGIALDGQRGNRLHIFTQEELFTQTIVESKPLSPELPEGTRVCAYWSQQYRCLYPGFVGKAPCPSADWSEPRVFVLFDDGDSGQIPTKNIRLIPPDIIPSEYESRLKAQDTISKPSKSRVASRSETSQRFRCSTRSVSKTNHIETTNENESKDSSCPNDSSCDDCQSSSQNTDPCSRHRSKHPSSSQGVKSRPKRHKKYREKHRRHHHRHHRHHRHHHHHHHSKKRKHRRKAEKPGGEGRYKSVDHSSVERNLPQSETEDTL